MIVGTLAPISEQLLSAVRLLRSRWRTLVVLALVPLLPLVFLLPFLLEYNELSANGIPASPSALSAAIAILAVIGFYVVGVPARGSIFFTLSERRDPGVRRALQTAWRRFGSLVLTEILVGGAIVLTFIPLLVVQSVYSVSIRPALAAALLGSVGDLFVVLILLALAIPPFFTAIWFGYAPLATAVGDARGGLPALRYSWNLLHHPRVFRAVAKRLVLWVVAFTVLCTAVHPLPYLNWLTPFVMALVGAAFLTVIYRQLNAGKQ